MQDPALASTLSPDGVADGAADGAAGPAPSLAATQEHVPGLAATQEHVPGLAAAYEHAPGRIAALPPALSATHSHILATVAGEVLARRPAGSQVRVLDVGCGDCRLLEYLATALPAALPGYAVDLSGFDIAGHATQPADFFDAALRRLAQAQPGTDWPARLRLIPEGEGWPYAGGAFDVVVSNQVLEHVADAGLFCAELARVLAPGGVSVHLYPSWHVVMEPHLLTPFVHWMGNTDLRRAWLALWARTGRSAFGRWAGSQGAGQTGAGQTGGGQAGVARYARVHADFLQRFTHYRTQGQMLALVKAAGLHGSFSASPGYVLCALQRRFRGRARLVHPPPAPLRASLLTLLLRYLTSVTLVAARDADYTDPGPGA